MCLALCWARGGGGAQGRCRAPVPWSTEVMGEGGSAPYRAGVVGRRARAACSKVRRPRPKRQEASELAIWDGQEAQPFLCP